jgi:hypothetical protein
MKNTAFSRIGAEFAEKSKYKSNIQRLKTINYASNTFIDQIFIEVNQ